MRRTLTVLAAALALGAAAPGTAQAASDPALCKSGGYVNYIDPATNAPFKNQGQCVSFVDGGGALVPVEQEPQINGKFELTPLPGLPDRCYFEFKVSALQPGTSVSYSLNWVSTEHSFNESNTVISTDGTWGIGATGNEDSAVSVTVNGQYFTDTLNCTP